METIPVGPRALGDGELIVIQASSNHGLAIRANDELVAFPFRRRTGRPLPGDRIRLDDSGTIDSIASRRNLFGRGDPRGVMRPIAANLDQVAIIIAPEPAPSPDLLHRYLAAAHIHRIRPLVVVNKSDLDLPDQPPFSQLDAFRTLGYAIIATRCEPAPELGELHKQLAGRTTLLAGQSGVGKTSLINALIPDLDLQTRNLSRVTGKGTHTTTAATLYRYPDNGWLIDTPGVWEYGLWAMSAEDLQRGFPEFAEPAAACQFRNCRHNSEPGCAVRKAVEQGTLPAFRHQAWLRLLAEQERLGGL